MPEGTEGRAAIDLRCLIELLRDIAEELDQHEDEVGILCEERRHDQRKVQRGIYPAPLIEHDELRYVQYDVRQEKGRHEEHEHEVMTLELETCEAVCRKGAGYDGQDDLRDDDLIGVQHGGPDIDISAVTLQRIDITLCGRVLRDEADAGEDLCVCLKGRAHHPYERIDHDDAHQNQDDILDDGHNLSFSLECHAYASSSE